MAVEVEEDGNLRSDYVMVGDTRVLEFNKAVDGRLALLLVLIWQPH